MTSEPPVSGPDLPDLLAFGRELIERATAVGAEPIIYGSLACAIHTGDLSLGLNDIDLLVPEAAFAGLMAALAADPSLVVEATSYHTVKVSRGPLKASFDAVERYLRGIEHGAARAAMDGVPFLVLDRQALARSYERAAETIPQKRDAYLVKLRKLRAPS
jgi:hypothetical protein